MKGCRQTLFGQEGRSKTRRLGIARILDGVRFDQAAAVRFYDFKIRTISTAAVQAAYRHRQASSNMRCLSGYLAVTVLSGGDRPAWPLCFRAAAGQLLCTRYPFKQIEVAVFYSLANLYICQQYTEVKCWTENTFFIEQSGCRDRKQLLNKKCQRSVTLYIFHQR